ncbi:hypothetical protein ACIQBJ_00490 [Kitasatospora sp. NPDC088391]|uniref:hypothetical protein n=1 Tax=Kitasatospora sp. NPDC088391 TaxID=3364074 RepID=UPI00382CD314
MLQQIEAELGNDQELEHALRTMRLPRTARLRRALAAKPRIVVVTLACCLALSFGVLGLAVTLNAPVLLGAVMTAWVVLLAALTVTARVRRRRRRR